MKTCDSRHLQETDFTVHEQHSQLQGSLNYSDLLSQKSSRQRIPELCGMGSSHQATKAVPQWGCQHPAGQGLPKRDQVQKDKQQKVVFC